MVGLDWRLRIRPDDEAVKKNTDSRKSPGYSKTSKESLETMIFIVTVDCVSRMLANWGFLLCVILP